MHPRGRSPSKILRTCGRPIIGRFLYYTFRCVIRRVRITFIGYPEALDLLDRGLENISLSRAGDNRPINQVRKTTAKLFSPIIHLSISSF